MRKIILLMMVLLPCTAFANSDCRIIEYPDHTEAVCVGGAEQTSASTQITELGQIPMQELIPGQEEIVASVRTTESEETDIPPEMIVRNGLARMYGDTWLRSRQGR